MEKNEYKSPHGWLIIFLIVFSLSVFLVAMVLSVDPDKKSKVGIATTTSTTLGTKKNPNSNPNSNTTLTVDNPIKSKPKALVSTTIPPIADRVARNGKVLRRHDKVAIVGETLKRHLHALPDKIVLAKDEELDVRTAYSTKDITLMLHGYEVADISVGKNMYIYDCSIVPTTDYLVVTVLMELPQISVTLKDHPDYSLYYPTINPYIHVVELVYVWGYDKETLETHPRMDLTNLKIFMVSWENNMHRKSYEQVKNSPLYKSNVPAPLDLKKEELYDFLTKSKILEKVPMLFNPPIVLQSSPHNNYTPLDLA